MFTKLSGGECKLNAFLSPLIDWMFSLELVPFPITLPLVVGKRLGQSVEGSQLLFCWLGNDMGTLQKADHSVPNWVVFCMALYVPGRH